MIKFGQPLLLQTIKIILKNNHKFIIQSDEDATYAKKQKKRDKISWNQSATIIDRKQAFSPVPGAWTKIKSFDKRIKILKAKVLFEKKINKLSNHLSSERDKLIVKCGKDSIQIIELQPEGKSKMNANDFLNGIKNKKLIFE